MKKISILLITLFTYMFFATIAYGASAKLDGKIENNLSVNDVTSATALTIILSGNEVKSLNDKITITLNGANWEGYAKNGTIDENVSYELTSSNVMKLKISTNEEILKKGYKFSVPLKSKIVFAKQYISAVVDYGYDDIADTTVNYASCSYSRAYIEGGVKIHSQGDKIYQKNGDTTYNKLKIYVAPSNAEEMKSGLTVKYEGAIWSDYNNSGKVICDRGNGAVFEKVNDTTLRITFTEYNSVMRYQGYTLTLPLTGTITGNGEIKATVDFGSSSIENSTVVFARCPDGTLSIKAENITPIDYCNKLSNVIISDTSTQGYNTNTQFEVSIGGVFHFAQVPNIEGTGKFKNKCKIQFKKGSDQKLVITITSKIESGETGEIKILNPIIQRDKKSNSSFNSVEINLTGKGWEKYDSTTKVAEYKAGVVYTPPIQIKVENPTIGASNKYSALSKITLTDNTDRVYKSGDKIILSFDNGFGMFSGGALPKVTSTGRFKDKCKLTVTSTGGYITMLDDIAGGTEGAIVISGIVLERSATGEYNNINLKVAYSGEENNYSTAQVAKYSSLYTSIPATTTTVSTTVTESTTETTTASVENTKTIKFKIGDINYSVKGENKELLAPPYIKDGYTMLPMRALANAVGITDDKISYSDGVATFKISDSVDLVITKGSNEYTLAGNNVNMSTSAEIKNGTMFLPMRDLAAAMGITGDNIIFNSETKEVVLNID